MEDFNSPNSSLIFLTEKIKCKKITSKNELNIFKLPRAGYVRLAVNESQPNIKKILFWYNNCEKACIIVNVIRKNIIKILIFT